jgi:hypothetical protein
MNTSNCLKHFLYKKRKFLVTLDKSVDSDDESITLSEEITVRDKPLKHVIKSDGVLNKVDPIMFACKNDKGEIEVSMQYEGFPLEPVLHYFKIIKHQWGAG